MKRALVTGGSGGIGEAICHALAAAGHELIVHAHRHPARAQAVVQAIRAGAGQHHEGRGLDQRAVGFDQSRQLIAPRTLVAFAVNSLQFVQGGDGGHEPFSCA